MTDEANEKAKALVAMAGYEKAVCRGRGFGKKKAMDELLRIKETECKHSKCYKI